MRVKFKHKGEQRKFIIEVLHKTNCPSLRKFEQFGIDVNYSTMKNYFCELRLIPKDLFENMRHLAKIDENEFEVLFLDDSWGKIKGGKKVKRKKGKIKGGKNKK